MTKTVDLSVAQASLAELIAGLGPTDELVVTQDNKPISRLLPTPRVAPVRGSCKGMLNIIAEDLEDFKDHMP